MPITDGFMLGQVIRYTVLEYLNELIEQGIEYPNALYIASKIQGSPRRFANRI